MPRISLDAAKALANEAGATYGVSPALVLAVIDVESSFNTEAVSAAQGQGLMQLIPSVQAQYSVSDPFDARQNVMAGTKHLAGYINRYNGRTNYGLAAYNRGPGNVPADQPLDERSWKYVNKVLTALKKYSSGGWLLIAALAAFVWWRYLK